MRAELNSKPRPWRSACLVLPTLLGGACSSGLQPDGRVEAAPDGSVDAAVTPLSREELLDPSTCRSCHPDHYRQWASSMHAYASKDPVFLAMNRRGQRETKGALGDFCVKCHAPQALREGATRDGLNLEELPQRLQGVSCYFCHNVSEVTGKHSNQLELADDTTLRGGLSDVRPTQAHASAYSELHDNLQPASSSLCGSCHDVMTQQGVHLERTFEQWGQSLYGSLDSASALQSCGACHMPTYRGSSVPGGPERVLHEHLWPGVDTALTDFPDKEVQQAAIDCALASVLTLQICPSPTGEFTISLSADVAHRWPTGSAQHRRAWLELVAFDENDQVLFETGRLADDQPVEEPPHAGSPCAGDRWIMRDHTYRADGHETHMLWDVAPSELHPLGYEECTLPSPIRLGYPHEVQRAFRFNTIPSRVEAKVHIRPVGHDVVDDLITSGDLDPAFRDVLPTHTVLGTITTWRKEDGFDRCVSTPRASPVVCPDAYQCLLRPDSAACTR